MTDIKYIVRRRADDKYLLIVANSFENEWVDNLEQAYRFSPEDSRLNFYKENRNEYLVYSIINS